MTGDSWGDDSKYASLTEEGCDALAAAADEAMAKGWQEYLDANPLDPELAGLVDFVFFTMGPPEPPYGSAERAAGEVPS